ncbi:MAG: hypothetical protein ACK4YP_14615 [Myxococcota bacterium]
MDLLFVALLIGACTDPPAPLLPPSTNGSTAPWVEWRAPDAPVRGPVVLVVDRPGGPMDQLVADPDVATFLNDRFHPMFERASAYQPEGTLQFLDGCGCALSAPIAPASPAAFIEAANTIVVRTDARRCQGQPFGRSCTTGPRVR